MLFNTYSKIKFLCGSMKNSSLTFLGLILWQLEYAFGKFLYIGIAGCNCPTLNFWCCAVIILSLDMFYIKIRSITVRVVFVLFVVFFFATSMAFPQGLWSYKQPFAGCRESIRTYPGLEKLHSTRGTMHHENYIFWPARTICWKHSGTVAQYWRVEITLFTFPKWMNWLYSILAGRWLMYTKQTLHRLYGLYSQYCEASTLPLAVYWSTCVSCVLLFLFCKVFIFRLSFK